jgi:hypothetical protein
MARALELALPPGSDREVADWVESIACEMLSARAAILARFEGATDSLDDGLPPDPTTQRRRAILPPGIPSALAPSLRDSAQTLPGLPGLVTPPPDAAEPLRTPMSMVSPASELLSLDLTSTRIGPVERESKRAKLSPLSPLGPLRTPIPMPAPEPKPRLAVGRIAALFTAPAIAALVFFVLRGVASSPTTAVETKPPPAVAAESAPTPVPVASESAAAGSETSGLASPSPSSSASAPPRGHHLHALSPPNRPPRKR